MTTRTQSPGVGVAAALEGAGLIAWNLVATPFVGKKRLRWGTQGTEATDPLPGDDLVPSPKWTYTLGVDIAASPEAIWPWIAQIGQRRGGFYTYQTLENMVGCKITNTTEILPEHQHPQVGDQIYLHPTAPPMRVEIVDPPHALVLFGSPADIAAEKSWGMSTWQFAIQAAIGWEEPPPHPWPQRLLPRLGCPACVRALPHRVDHVRDEPQDDA